MPPSAAERYERILQADPRSRVFVELARALLEGGDAPRAAEVCRNGLRHHPTSVQGHVLWARALLAQGQVEEAVARGEAPVALPPPHPYACDLAAEALEAAGHAVRALPLLERGALLHPGDRRILRRLRTARELGGAEGTSDGASANGPVATAPGAVAPAIAGVSPPHALSSPPPGGGAHPAGVQAFVPEPLPPAAPPPAADARPDRPGDVEPAPKPVVAAPANAARPLAERPAGGTPDGSAPALPPWPSPTPRTPSESPLLAGIPEASPEPTRPAEDAGALLDILGNLPAREPLAPAGPPLSQEPFPRGPGAPAETHAEAAAREAARYERELRARMLPQAEAHRPFLRRHALAVALVGAALVALVGAVSFFAVRARHRDEDVRAAVEGARKGLARDTLGALREASRVLAQVRRTDPGNAEALTLSAEVAAVLAHDFGDAAETARASELLASGRAGEGALATRWALARTAGERTAAGDALVAGAGQATPLARALAGEVLAARGKTGEARAQLDAAARASPPLLRAIALLGDLDLAAGDAERASERYRLALRAHATHPRSAIGEAEARLRLGSELPDALRRLEAVEADPGSAPPIADRLRFELAMARLLAAGGRLAEADKRLTSAASRFTDRPEIPAAQADAHARAGDLDRAQHEADAALRLAPGDPQYRELAARLQLARGRYRELLSSTEASPTRTLLLYRGAARYALGEPERARQELEATRRDGRMPAEAAAWTALAELALGHRQQAETIATALLTLPAPPPLALVARARLDLARGDASAAERGLRDALTRDPDLLEGPRDLARLLLARGAAGDAVDVLQRASGRHRADLGLRLDLGRARLAAGDAQGAVRELDGVVAERPRDAEAFAALSAARLGAGDAPGARRAAESAAGLAPNVGAYWLAAAGAAEAQGDADAAKRLRERARRGSAPATSGTASAGHKKVAKPAGRPKEKKVKARGKR